MITVEINERTKVGKAVLEMLRLLSKEEGVRIIENSYNDEFVREIKTREKDSRAKELTKVNPDDVWGSIL